MSLDAIGIVSRDIEKSIKFYSFLGIEIKEAGGPDHFEGETPSGVRIMIDTEELMKKLNPEWTRPAGSSVVLCFKQGASNTVDHVYTEIVSKTDAKGVTPPWDAFWGQRYSSVLDPDGNQVDIFADL